MRTKRVKNLPKCDFCGKPAKYVVDIGLATILGYISTNFEDVIDESNPNSEA